MKLIILPYSSIPNPLGFPGDYPAERKLIGDSDAIPPGWIQVTEQEYQTRFQTHYATVAAIIDARESTEKTALETRHTQFITALRRLENLNDKLTAGTHTAAERLEAEIINHRITILIANWALEQLRNS